MNKNPLVAIILTTWNNFLDTKECLDSLHKISYHNYKVIIVDNNSHDGTVEKIKRLYKKVIVVKNEKGVSYTKAINQGFRKSLEIIATYTLLLNNDTVVQGNFLKVLVRRLQSDSEIGIASSKMFFYEEKDRIWYAGGIVDYKRGLISHVGFDEIDRGQYEVAKQTGYCTACSVLYSNIALKKIGLLDESYEMYVSDVEHSERAKKNGYKIFYEPKSVIWHKVSRSRTSTNPYKEYMKSKEIVRFFFKENPYATIIYTFRRLKESVLYFKKNPVFSFKIVSGLLQGYLVSFR